MNVIMLIGYATYTGHTRILGIQCVPNLRLTIRILKTVRYMKSVKSEKIAYFGDQ